MTTDFRERYFSAQDGLRLYYRDYGDPLSAGVPIICLPGLARNSSDFDHLARRLSATHRIICPDLRGRGMSAYDPDEANYRPETYILDTMHLMSVAGCHRVIVIGTSLGGILAMALAAVHPTCLAGVIINDIGPEIDPTGLARIKSYIGKDVGHMSEDEALDWVRNMFGPALPDVSENFWHEEVRRSFKPNGQGRFILNYDPRISRVTQAQTDELPDIWPYFRALRQVPALAFRGALSDLLSAETFQQMACEKPDMWAVTVPNRGHVPLLDEPECTEAIDAFLAAHGHDRH